MYVPNTYSHAQRPIHNWTLLSRMKTSSTTYHMGSEMECSIICGGQFTLIVCGVSNHLEGKVGREGVREGGGARRNMKREFDPHFW